MKILVILVAALLLGLVTFEFSNEGTRRIFFNSNGGTEQGSAFGVEIGNSREEAIASLSQRYTHRLTKTGGRCLGRVFPEDHVLDVFADQTWRRGSICVASKGGDVVALQWLFNPFTP